jgi:hypothetical protein
MQTHKREGQELLHSFLALRKAIGWIAISLPVVLVIAHGASLTSVSQAYYRHVSSIFVGAVCAIGVFLIFYRGYDGRDRIASMVAGLSAIAVSQIPCGNQCRAPAPDMTYVWQWANTYPNALRWTHFIAAAVMFAALAYFCLVLFPETDKQRGHEGERKLRRNKIYRACGYVIIGSMAILGIDALLEWTRNRRMLWEAATFCFEALMILAFGFSWAVKGDSFPILSDRVTS